MNRDSKFRKEEDDIVRLETKRPEEDPQRLGWVNVGAFSIEIAIDEFGDLKIEVFPCGNEEYPLVKCVASKGWALHEGATDCDA